MNSNQQTYKLAFIGHMILDKNIRTCSNTNQHSKHPPKKFMNFDLISLSAHRAISIF
jgi:hypothetical protein